MDCLILSLISVLFLCFIVASKEMVKVTLYYETLCPFSIKFINDQLYPGYQKLGNVLSLELIPFGKGKIFYDQGKKTIKCQHGESECYGNKIHACAIENNTQGVWMNFIGCDMATFYPEDQKVAEKCAERYNISWKKLKTCAESDEGSNLLIYYAELTKKANVIYVPHIIFNHMFNRTLERKARGNFVATVCDLLTEKPSVC